MQRFSIGQIVQHRRYRYRGVVAGSDPMCMAEDEWYEGNRTQPSREQPWYHVLVDGGRETYVAQENLSPDPKAVEVDHPMIERAFVSYRNGRYFRDSLN